MKRFATLLAVLLVGSSQASSMLAPPQWTTLQAGEAKAYRKTYPELAFRRVFELRGPVASAEWIGSGRIYLNGREIANGTAVKVDASCFVEGRNVLGVVLASNRANRGFIGSLNIKLERGGNFLINSNLAGWRATKVTKKKLKDLSWLALDHDVGTWERAEGVEEGTRPSWNQFKKDVAWQIPLWSDGLGPIGEGKTEPANAYLQIFRPEKPNGTTMVVCAGGGYGRNFWYGLEGVGTAKWLNRHGITAAVLVYRLPGGNHHRTLADVKRAMRYVRSQSRAWQVQADNIGIIGFSAGGHLAATASTNFDLGESDASDAIERVSSRPDFAVLVYPVISLGEHTHAGTRKGWLGRTPTDEQVTAFSSHMQVTEQTPPAFLTHATDDVMVPPKNSELYLAALQQHKVSAQYLPLPKGGHGFRLLPGGMGGKNWEPWRQAALAWMKKHGFVAGASTIE